ncbi:MAG: HAD family hydrolase [Myxococcota bacterium]
MRSGRGFILDVDDVLLEMERSVSAAEGALRRALEEPLGAAEARAIEARIQAQYAILKGELRRTEGAPLPEAGALRKRIVGWQRGVALSGHEVKLWSREVMLAIALEDRGHKPERGLIRTAVDAYWDEVAERSALHPDAKRLIDALIAGGEAFHLATNSDGFLELDEAGRTFFYDPEDARARKMGRLRPIWAAGVKREAVTIGDPVGKPHPAFYERVIQDFGRHLGALPDKQRLLAVGDSWSNDVAPFLSMGVGQGVLILRGQPRPTTLGKGGRIIEALTELLASEN